MEFLSEDEFRKLETSMLKADFEACLERFLKVCVEETLKVLPSVVGHLVKSAANLQGLSEDFYVENKDLVDHKVQVAKVMEKLEAKNPGKGLKDLLKETGNETRRILKLQAGFNLNSEVRPAIVDMDKGFGEL